MPATGFLEVFDVTFDTNESNQPSADWQAGYEQGMADRMAAFEEEQSVLAARLVQRLEDMSFAFAEARQLLEQELSVFFEALADVFVPQFAQEMLVPLVVEQLLDTTQQGLSAKPLIKVPVQDVIAMTDAVSARTDLPFDIVSDPFLDDGQVIVGVGDNASLIDLSAAISHVQEALAPIVVRSEPEKRYG